jgi:hypothetical protein
MCGDREQGRGIRGMGREGGPGKVKKEKEREYDEWVPRQQNRRGRENTQV